LRAVDNSFGCDGRIAFIGVRTGRQRLFTTGLPPCQEIVWSGGNAAALAPPSIGDNALARETMADLMPQATPVLTSMPERSMKKLILIKHAAPTVDPALPPDRWELSDVGKARCVPLAERLKAHHVAALISSEEVKAIQTAKLTAAQLGVPCATAPGLHEHDRNNVPQMASRDFISALAQFFANPRQLVLGSETADQARQRFTASLEACAQPADGNLAVVSHGTVIALYLEQYSAEKPFLLWRRLGLPSFVVLSWPQRKILEVATGV